MFEDFMKNLQGMMGGNPDDINKQMEQMQKQMEAQMNAHYGNEKKGWDAEEGVYYAKGSFDDSVEYNNELMCLSNYNTDMMEEMNDAMDDEDFQRAEAVRLQWIDGLKEVEAQADKLGAYKGDDSLLKAFKKLLSNWDSLMKDGYKKLIEFRLAGKRGTPVERAQLAANNEFIAEFTEEFNDVSDDFIAKYEDEED